MLVLVLELYGVAISIVVVSMVSFVVGLDVSQPLSYLIIKLMNCGTRCGLSFWVYKW